MYLRRYLYGQSINVRLRVGPRSQMEISKPYKNTLFFQYLLNKVVLKYQNLNHIVFHIGMGYIYLVGPGYGFFFAVVGSGSKSAPPGSITLGFKSSYFCNNKFFILLYLSFGCYTMQLPIAAACVIFHVIKSSDLLRKKQIF